MPTESSNQEEELYRIPIGQGMYTSELASNIPDGFSAVCYNTVATGDSLENRIGIRRSSVDWKIIDNNFPSTDASQNACVFEAIRPMGFNSALPAFMWGSQGYTVPGMVAYNPTLNLVRAWGTTDAADGFMSVNVASNVMGICQYQNTIYFSMNGVGIHKITNINWTTDVVTSSLIASSSTLSLQRIFTFKDRIWGHQDTYLYFTDIPATGSLPETWAAATNRIRFVGPNGSGRIHRVIPRGNKLLVFTSVGLFTLLVEGAPASWILRILDSTSCSTSSQCAFESKGIVYFINTQGVWATDGTQVTKLSGAIEDQFFLAKGNRVHTINFYEDGILISITKIQTNGSAMDSENSKNFYSKMDPIAWSEWGINSYGLGSGSTQIVQFWSLTSKIPTYLNTEPTVYVLAVVSDSTEAVPRNAVPQLLIMDGGQDQYVKRDGTISTDPVGVYLKTKHFDGDNPIRFKHAKQAFIEMYSSDSQHQFEYSWDNDYTTDESTEIRDVAVNETAIGLGSNLIRVQADFRYRRASFNFRAFLQTAESQIKLKEIAMYQDTTREMIEIVN